MDLYRKDVLIDFMEFKEPTVYMHIQLLLQKIKKWTHSANLHFTVYIKANQKHIQKFYLSKFPKIDSFT